MFKNFINNIKLSRLTYLLEMIEVRDFRGKITAYNKIKRMKLTKEMGLQILNEFNYEHSEDDYSDFNISLSLISLIFRDYYDEYSDKLEEIFPKLTIDSKYEILNLLANTKNDSAILLYKKLVIKYFNDFDNIPLGALATNKDNYSLLFPDLFKVLKEDKVENNILLLFNDFLNAGVVLEKDIVKNKKVLQTAVNNILKKGINFKFNKDEIIMQNKEYIALRIFLETAINIEFYVSNKTTNSNLDKLYKKKDNQLKLFILDNYVRKGKDISKIRLNTIAKDELSRYPLFSFLKFYNLERLMPKKYANNRALSESDLFINYSINFNYNLIPFDFEYIGEREVDNYNYYIYKFKTRYNYYDEVKNPTTDYIFKNLAIDREVLDKTIVEHIGMSGGFNKDLDPSLIEFTPRLLLVDRYDTDTDKVINGLISYVHYNEPVKKEKVSFITRLKNKFKKKEKVSEEEKVGFFAKIKNKFKKKDKVVTEVETPVTEETAVKTPEEPEVTPLVQSEEEKQETKIGFFTKIKNKFKRKDKNKDLSVTKVEKTKKKNKLKDVIEEDEEEYKKPSLLRRIFSFNTLLLLIFIVFVGSFLVLLSYIFDMDIFNIKKNSDPFSTIVVDATKLEKDNISEISFNDIFNQEGSNYYVLFYKKSDKSSYYTYLNTILDSNNYKFFYVDLNKEENQGIYSQNDTGFIITDETLLKVRDKEYEFYVVGKNNILREMNDYIKSIQEEKKAEEEKKKAEEELNKQKEAEKAIEESNQEENKEE